MRVREVCHIITGTDTGGAEAMLYKLLSAVDQRRFRMQVISLMPVGAVGQQIAALGVPVRSLQIARGRFSPGALGRLTRWLAEMRPDVVQTWMYHADLLGGVAARLARCRRVFWNIRNGTFDPRTSKRTTMLVARACARLSRRVPDRILCCSEVARQAHEALGYAPERFCVVPNGFDLRLFQPSTQFYREVREELQIGSDALLVGLIARFDPQKDHHTFVQAAYRLRQRHIPAHFLLCGNGIDRGNTRLAHWIQEAGLEGCCHLLGRRQDVPRLTAALDVAASSSAYGEAFANVLGEAMACGVPCVATDVGDARMIIADTGRIVPPRDPEALASALAEILQMPPDQRCELGRRARRRVEAEFSLPAIVARYEQLYEEQCSQDDDPVA
ncbi:MAG: glycosyltransferase [Chloroherpetonaceae bacterium]|nr:glycosyltransferase [Chthonomonadaceae bacterium]MDW8209085.1 glycosyltransferase [Chloroherpetonaceae bacterium]